MTALLPNYTDDHSVLQLQAYRKLATGELMLLTLNHDGPEEHSFHREGIFWLGLCLTPRRSHDKARYADHWSPHRFEKMGPIIALPPGFRLQLKSDGGQHISVICALKAEAVQRWLPDDFDWTDRRLESCINIASPALGGLLRRLSHELRHPGIGDNDLFDAIVIQISVELARYLLAIDEPTERGGLAAWRLRLIDKRIEASAPFPTLVELAQLCNISTRQLTRGFRTSRGCSIGDYVEACRIEAAKRRLATDEGIKTIAMSLGFSSQSAFTYAFRRSAGVTPHDFRQRIIRRLDQTDIA